MILLLLFLITNSIYSQDESNQQFSELRSLLDRGNIQVAEKRVEELLDKNPGEPTLTLYQTEIWIEKANKLYEERKFKSAFIFYERAYKNWNTHPVVRKRYFELKDRKLIDYSPTRATGPESKFGTEKEISRHSIRPNDEYLHFLKSQEEKLSELNQKIETISYRSTMGIGILLGMNFTLLIAFLFKNKK